MRHEVGNKTKIVLIMIAVLIFIFTAIKARQPKPQYYETRVIDRGETLWELALEAAGDNADPREVIYIMAKKNGIKNVDKIYEGQIVTVPVYEVRDGGDHGN